MKFLSLINDVFFLDVNNLQLEHKNRKFPNFLPQIQFHKLFNYFSFRTEIDMAQPA